MYGNVHFYKYLGVWLTSTLNWSKQLSEVCKKAQVTSGYSISKVPSLCKYCITLATVTGLHLSTSRVRSTFYQQGLINSLERVQKFAPKTGALIMSPCFNYAIRLPLPARTHYLKLCLLNQVVNGHMNFPKSMRGAPQTHAVKLGTGRGGGANLIVMTPGKH